MPWMASIALLLALPAAFAAAAEPAAADGPGAETRPATGAGVDPGDPWSAAGIAPDMDSRPLPRNSTSGISLPRDGARARTGGSWLRTTLALAGVVGLIVLLGWGYRAMASHGGRLPLLGRARNPALIEVLGRTALSARQSLCLVRIGPRLVLLGVTPDAIRALDVIDDADLTARLAGEAARGQPHSSSAEFARCLEDQARGYQSDDGLDETVTPDETRMVGIKQQLAGTIARLRARSRQTW